jgi:hypothetical protein
MNTKIYCWSEDRNEVEEYNIIKESDSLILAINDTYNEKKPKKIFKKKLENEKYFERKDTGEFWSYDINKIENQVRKSLSKFENNIKQIKTILE